MSVVYTAAELAKRERAIAEAVREMSAQVVDQCNREGPYNAIGAGTRIRAIDLASILAAEESREPSPAERGVDG